MNLIKLTTTNWRSFYGKHELTFSNKKNKHVTLIHGQNGTGKTTMINAIKWCLYRTTPDFDKELEIEGIDNVEIAHWDTWKVAGGIDGDSKFEVELIFEHDSVEYRATRAAHQKDMKGKSVANGKDEFTLFKKDLTGNSKLIDEAQSAISRILPAELSDYFLFSGETVSKVLDASANLGLGYKKAVRDILGFTLSDIALEDLDKLEKKNTAQINQLIKANKLTSEIGTELTKLNDDKLRLEGQISDLKLERDGFQKIVDDCNEKIRQSDHRTAKDLQDRLEKKEEARDKEIVRRKGFLDEKIDLIEKYGFAIFGSYIDKDFQPLLKAKHDGNIPPGHRDTFINKLLSEHECICGEELIENTPKYDKVKALLDSANTELIDDRVKSAFNMVDHFKGRADHFISDLARITDALDKSDSLIRSYIEACSKFEEKLKNLGNTNIDKLLDKKEQAKVHKQTKVEAISGKQLLRNNLITQIGEINKDLKKIKSDNPVLELRQNIERVIHITKRRLKLNQEKFEEKSRSLISNTVQKNMTDFSHRDYSAVVDENFNVNLTVLGTETIAGGVGEGTEMLAKLSFITSLIAYSKKRERSKSTWAAQGTIAPFVIDAPFAGMDEDYQESTLKFLPNQSHQVIVFLSNSQWQEDYEKVIGDFIGKRYYYVNHVKPGKPNTTKPLRINGKEYKVENDDWDKAHYGTTIEKIL